MRQPSTPAEQPRALPVSRRSRQISAIRSMSACAANQMAVHQPSVRSGSSAATTHARSPSPSRPKSTGGARAGHADRPDTSRRSGTPRSGIRRSPACPRPSRRHHRHGTRIDEARSSSSARVLGSSDATTCSSKSNLASRRAGSRATTMTDRLPLPDRSDCHVASIIDPPMLRRNITPEPAYLKPYVTQLSPIDDVSTLSAQADLLFPLRRIRRIGISLARLAECGACAPPLIRRYHGWTDHVRRRRSYALPSHRRASIACQSTGMSWR